LPLVNKIEYVVVFYIRKKKWNGKISPMTDQSDRLSVLADEAKKGSIEAANSLASLLQKEVFRMIYYRIYSREDAEDLTQEVFIKMFKAIGKLDDTNKIRPWLFAIALNRVRDFKRWKSIETLFSRSEDDLQNVSESSNDPGDKMESLEFLKNLQQFTTKLPKGEREIFMLRFVDNLGIAEIAETLKKNESTVKTHLYRAIKKFKEDQAAGKIIKGEKA
jgi:RNA polymerase sigma-70 factor (ECF subfamily)